MEKTKLRKIMLIQVNKYRVSIFKATVSRKYKMPWLHVFSLQQVGKFVAIEYTIKCQGKCEKNGSTEVSTCPS